MTLPPSGRESPETKSGKWAMPTLWREIITSLLMAVALILLGALVQRILWTRGISGITAYFDDLLVGLVAGLLVFGYERSHSENLRQKLEMIAEMNHHIRNALQSIACVAYADEKKQVQIIQHSVSRIEWALQKILPGAEERKPTKFWDTDPTDVMCPVCWADKNAPCENATAFHPERVAAAEIA